VLRICTHKNPKLRVLFAKIATVATSYGHTTAPEIKNSRANTSRKQISDVGGDCWRTKMLVPWWKARNLKSCKLNYKQAAGISPRLRQGND
jgi:hypothetical protein